MGRSSEVFPNFRAYILKIVGSFNSISIIVRPRNLNQDHQQWANVTTQEGFYPSEKVFIAPRPVVV